LIQLVAVRARDQVKNRQRVTEWIAMHPRAILRCAGRQELALTGAKIPRKDRLIDLIFNAAEEPD
jgi:hypothetical protein